MHAAIAQHLSPKAARRSRFAALVLVLVLGLAAPAQADIGLQGPSYVGASAPTGQKPQSKLWHADGIWWGSLFNSFAKRFEIHRLDEATGAWTPTGTPIDSRGNSSQDVLWDGTHLYVASAGKSPTNSLDSVNVYRFSYAAETKTWSRDAGFPVTVVTGGMEAIVLDKDSGGRIWVTYTRSGKAYVAHSTADQTTWTAPYVIPVAGASNLASDDMSSIVAYGEPGDRKIGVMWSNQNSADWAMYFATHDDDDPDATWTVAPAVKAPEYADDHLNVKSLEADASGRVFAVTKTSLNDLDAPLMLVLVLDGNGNWQRHTYGRVVDNHTRPLLQIDRSNRQLYVFAASPCCSGGTIYYKRTSLDRISFESGLGTPFLQSATDTHINNIAGTKQELTAGTGLVAIAGDDHTRRYWHNRLDLSAVDSTPPDTVLNSTPSDPSNSASASFSFSATEPGATFECRLDASAFTKCTSPVLYDGLADGAHTFSVRSIDTAGNVDATPAAVTWTVATTVTAKTFPASADAYVEEDQPTRNFGANTTLGTDRGTGTSEESYFRFDVADVHGTVVSAKLRAYVVNGTGNGPAVYAADNAWTESGLTWSSRPVRIGAASDDKGIVTSGTWVEYDVTPLVSGNGPHSFVTVATSTDGMNVNSREYASRVPTLELTVDPSSDTQIDARPGANVATTTADFAFSASEAGSTFECRLDAGTWEACSSPKSYGGLADGAHTFEVRAVETTGAKDETPARAEWTVDTVAPQTPTIALEAASDTGISSTDNLTADADPAFTGAAEPGSRVRLRQGATILARTNADESGAWSVATEPLDEGEHEFHVTSSDAAGNTTQSQGTLAVTIDLTPPVAPTLSAPVDGTVSSASTLSVSGGSEAAADRVEVFDGETSAGFANVDPDGGWTFQMTGLSDGEHTVSAKAVDAAGNSSDASNASTVAIDTTAPETSVDTGPSDPTTATSADLRFSSDEAGSTFMCSLDGAEPASCSSPVSYSSLAAGEHQFEVYAVDAGGNADASPAVHSWTIDPSAPEPPVITTPEDGSAHATSTVMVGGTSTTEGLTLEIYDGETLAGSTTSGLAGAWSFSLEALGDGAHSISARVVGADGSRSPESNVRTITVDTVDPSTSIEDAPSSLTNSTTATFAFSSDEPAAAFECRLDSDAFTPCASPKEYTGLADGSHAFEVRATDAAGNSDATPARQAWEIDTRAPETTIDSGPTAVVAVDSATFTFSADEAGSTFECRLDDGTFAPCDSPQVYSDVSAGAHTFEVRATDAAGNPDGTPAGRQWTIETSLFSDGFETGDFSRWSAVLTGADGTATAQSSTVMSGSWAARLSASANTGSYAVVRRDLGGSRTDVTVRVDLRVDVEGASGSNVPLLRVFDENGARLVSLYRQNLSSNRIGVTHSGGTHGTSGRLALATWGRFEMRVITGGAGASTIIVSHDGTEIYNTTAASLGTAGTAMIQIGNETRRQAFALVADDIEVDAR